MNEKIYVVCLESGEYEDYEKSIEFVSTSLYLVQTKTEELLFNNQNEYTNVIIEIWQDNEYYGALEYNKERIVSYRLFNWHEIKQKC